MKDTREHFEVYTQEGNVVRFVEQSVPTVESVYQSSDEIEKALKALPRPRFLIVDVRCLQQAPPVKARRRVFKLMDEDNMDGIAILGASVMARVVSRLMASKGEFAKVEFFDDEAEACAWFKKIADASKKAE